MSEETADQAAQEHPGVPDSQWEAEHPSGEAAEQEAREYASRMPGAQAPADEDEAAASDEMAATDQAPTADDAPAEG